MYKVVNRDNVQRFKVIAFLGSILWNIENPILEIQVQECVGEFQAWSLFAGGLYSEAVF